MKVKKGLDGELDKAWSLLVKHKAKWKCEVCGKRDYLNSHHVFTRRNKSVRWSIMNGVCLCPSHHTLSSKFSAHGTPVTFNDWLIKKRGQNYVDILTIKANSIHKWHKFEKEILLKELLKEIKNYETKNQGV